jgi:hypothetical protein
MIALFRVSAGRRPDLPTSSAVPDATGARLAHRAGDDGEADEEDDEGEELEKDKKGPPEDGEEETEDDPDEERGRHEQTPPSPIASSG